MDSTGDRIKDERRRSFRNEIRKSSGELTLSFFTGSFCMDGHTSCSYERKWHALVKYKVNGHEYLAHMHGWAWGHSKSNKYEMFTMGLAAKARREFKYEDADIISSLKTLPECE